MTHINSRVGQTLNKRLAACEVPVVHELGVGADGVMGGSGKKKSFLRVEEVKVLLLLHFQGLDL